MSRITFTRRKALESLGVLIAGSSLAQAQGKGLTGETPSASRPAHAVGRSGRHSSV